MGFDKSTQLLSVSKQNWVQGGNYDCYHHSRDNTKQGLKNAGEEISVRIQGVWTQGDDVGN